MKLRSVPGARLQAVANLSLKVSQSVCKYIWCEETGKMEALTLLSPVGLFRNLLPDVANSPTLNHE